MSNTQREPVGIRVNIENPELGNYEFEIRNENEVTAITHAIANFGSVSFLRFTEGEGEDETFVIFPRAVLEQSIITIGQVFDEPEEE